MPVPALLPPPLPVGGDAPSAQPDETASLRRARRRLVAANIVGVLLLAGLCAVALLGSRQAYRARALTATDNLAQTLALSLASEVDRIDLALRLAVRAHDDELADGTVEAAARARVAAEHEILLGSIHALRVSDTQGTLSGARLSPAEQVPQAAQDDECFGRARREAGPRLLVCGPRRSLLDNAWVVTLARRVEAAGGAFAGMVYAEWAIERIEQRFATVDLGQLGAVTLRMADLRLVARRSGKAGPTVGVGTSNVSDQLRTALARAPRAGAFLATTQLDQVERSNSYRQVGEYPLVLLAGLAIDEYQAPWRQEAALTIGLAGLLALLMAVGSALAWRGWLRRLAADRAAVEEAQRYRALLNTATDGIHVVDAQGRLVDCNDGFARMLGYRREELLGRLVSFWDANVAEPSLSWLAAAARTGQRRDFVAEHRRRDGSLMEVEIATVGLHLDGRNVIFCSARDRTERLRQEAALRRSEEQRARTGRVARVGGWEVALPGRWVDWSDEAAAIHDMPRGHRPSRHELMACYGGPARRRINDALRDCLRRCVPLDVEAPMLTAMGRSRWVRIVGDFDRDPATGRPVRLVGAVQDITAFWQRGLELAREQAAREQAEQHARELDQLLRERGEMLDVLAHEVRQPLNNASAALQGAGTALVLAGYTEAQTEVQARLQRAQNVMSQVLANVDNTLAAAALLARSDPIERQDTDIDMLVAVAMADMPAEERGRIHVERATTTRTASMDMSLLRLALRNLLSNALKFSPPGSPVRVRLADSDDPLALLIDVIDAGEGVPPNQLARLFERGARGASRRGPLGHGLGLYIVRRVMELHGGRVLLAENGPQGATFRLVIEQADQGAVQRRPA